MYRTVFRSIRVVRIRDAGYWTAQGYGKETMSSNISQWIDRSALWDGGLVIHTLIFRATRGRLICWVVRHRATLRRFMSRCGRPAAVRHSKDKRCRCTSLTRGERAGKCGEHACSIWAASEQHLGAEDQPLATAMAVLSIDCVTQVTRRGGTKGAGIRGWNPG